MNDVLSLLFSVFRSCQGGSGRAGRRSLRLKLPVIGNAPQLLMGEIADEISSPVCDAPI
jgi:hypothetical protein